MSITTQKLKSNVSKNISSGAKAMPVVSECRNVAEGISTGDFKKAAMNGGILSFYATSAGSGAANKMNM